MAEAAAAIREKAGSTVRREKKQNPVFDETMILERKDGSLLMFARDRSPLLVKCESPDLKGTQWSDGTFTNIVNAGAYKKFIKKIQAQTFPRKIY